jgi:hypothetical protein
VAGRSNIVLLEVSPVLVCHLVNVLVDILLVFLSLINWMRSTVVVLGNVSGIQPLTHVGCAEFVCDIPTCLPVVANADSHAQESFDCYGHRVVGWGDWMKSFPNWVPGSVDSKQDWCFLGAFEGWIGGVISMVHARALIKTKAELVVGTLSLIPSTSSGISRRTDCCAIAVRRELTARLELLEA